MADVKEGAQKGPLLLTLQDLLDYEGREPTWDESMTLRGWEPKSVLLIPPIQRKDLHPLAIPGLRRLVLPTE